MKYAFVRANREEFHVMRMCQVLQVSRSGYYDWQGVRSRSTADQDGVLLKKIRKIHLEMKEAYGATQDVADFKAVRDGVRQASSGPATARAGIEARRKRKFRLAYKARNTAPAPPNLLRWPFKAAYPDQIWVTDVTFIPRARGGYTWP